MANMRRPTPEPPPGPPQIQFKPGTAQRMLRELAPLLAEEGIDVDNIDVPDMETLQRAMDRAVERHNMALFTPVGQARELAAVTLRLVIEAIRTTTPPSPRRSSSRSNQSPLTTPPPPSPAASAWRSVCSPPGCPATTPIHRPASVSGPGCPPGTGPVNAPPPTSSSSPAKAARFAH